MSRSASLLRSAGSGLAGFLAYGGWAFYANMGESEAAGMRAGLLQGGYSFVLTFLSTLMMEAIHGRCVGRPRARLETIAITGVVLLTVPLALHLLAGTPNVLLTILPGFLIGMVYTTVYVSALDRVAGRGASSPAA